MLAFWLKDTFSVFLFYPLRTLLSLIGISLGIGAICALISINVIVKQNSKDYLKKYGNATFVMTLIPVEASERKMAKELLSHSNVAKLSNYFGAEYQLIPYQSLSSYSTHRFKKLDAIVVATLPDIFSTMQWQVAKGRVLHRLDEQDKVVVIGAQVAKKLKDLGMKNILNENISIEGSYFNIVGVLSEQDVNPILEFDPNQAIFISIPLAKRLKADAYFDSFIVYSTQSLNQAQQYIKNRIQSELKIQRVLYKDAHIFLKVLYQQAHLTLQILSWVAAMTLFLGVVSILNLLLVLINERKQEIGLRLALGATSTIVGLQFLRETLFLCISAGLIGLLIGTLGSYFIIHHLGMVYYLPLGASLAGFPISLVLGLIVGIVPALMARHADPVKLLKG